MRQRALLGFLGSLVALTMLYPTLYAGCLSMWKPEQQQTLLTGVIIVLPTIFELIMVGLTVLIGVIVFKANRTTPDDSCDCPVCGHSTSACLDSCCDYMQPPYPPPPPLPKPSPPPRKGKQKPGSTKKRKKLASLRKGFVKERKKTITYNPGPNPNPNSKTRKLRAKQRLSMNQRLAEKMTLGECVWKTSKQGGLRKSQSVVSCCTRKDCYRDYAEQAGGKMDFAILVSSYRKYYHSLNYDQQRQWWDEHTTYTGYDVVAAGGTLKRNGAYHQTRCENVAIMKSRIATARPTDTMRPVPDSAFVPVCSKFLVFLTAGNHNTKDQHAIRRNAFNGPTPAEPEDLDVSLKSVRSARSPGDDKNDVRADKTAHVRLWLEHQGNMSLMDPSEDYSILPYRSCAETHAHYVYDEECDLGKPWAPDSFEAMFDARRDSKKPSSVREMDSQEAALMEDLGVLEDDPAAGGCDAEHADAEDDEKDEDDVILRREKRNRSKKYRYGNRMCGMLNEDKPEDPIVCSYSRFNTIWREDDKLRKIICREHIPFAKCDYCIQHRAKAERKRTPDAVETDNKALRAHIKDVENEKLMYYSNRARARKWPKTYLSIIIDGADQSKHDMPHFKDMSHLTNELRRIKMHLYGALVHGQDAYAFTITDHEQQGHNSTIQVLHYILLDLAKRGPLPPILKLQLDNTTKQNKGQFLFGFLSLLVECGVFRSIEVSYLPVGHTHA